MGFIGKALAAVAFMYAGVLMVTCMAESVHGILVPDEAEQNDYE